MRLSAVQRCVFHILSITYNLGMMCRSGLRVIVKLPVPLTFAPALIFCVIFLQPTKQIQNFFLTLFPFTIACKVLQKYFQMSFLSHQRETATTNMCVLAGYISEKKKLNNVIIVSFKCIPRK